ncbi:hypothetical protein Barb4_01630 [Bacteroidales bacterium Barb4]|nr:hypothetical protein Barb4_01630 [Bacteroidales bacterium Barb4]
MVYNAIYIIRSPLLTPHSAMLHVGLKSPALSGHLRRIGTIVLPELWYLPDIIVNIKLTNWQVWELY